MTCMHTLSCTSTRVVHTYDTTLQRLAVSDVANEISQKNSEDIRVCLRENRRRELRTYLLRSETQLLSLDWLEARDRICGSGGR